MFGFVKQSGGHIELYSESGCGTSVKIYLPRYRGEPSAQSDPLEEAALPLSKANEILLVAEDDEGVRHIVVECLCELGYAVTEAASGDEAIQALAHLPRVDLLLTDIVMPGVTGRVLADQILAVRPDLKVLYMTGYTRNAVVYNGVLDAGVAFLQKPFTSEQLARKVRAVLDG